MCATTQNDENETTETEIASVNALVASKSSSRFLATAMVKLVAKSGEKKLLRALVDDGSESAFISEQAVQLLKLNKENVSASISGIGAAENRSKNIVTVTIGSRFDDEFGIETEAIVLEKLTNYNKMTGQLSEYEHLKNLRLADIISKYNEPIDIILGTTEHGIIIKPGLIKGMPDETIARDSELGWLVSGGIGDKDKTKVINVVTLISNVEMNKKIGYIFCFK